MLFTKSQGIKTFIVLLFLGIILSGSVASSSLDALSFTPVAVDDPVQALTKALATMQKAQLATAFGATKAVDGTAAGARKVTSPAVHFARATDTFEHMALEAPLEWREVDSGPWLEQGEKIGFFLTAAGDLGKFNSDLSAAGVFFGVSTTLAQQFQEQDLLASEAARLRALDPACQQAGQGPYVDAFYHGHYYIYTNCRGQATHVYLSQVSTPMTGGQVIVLRINLPDGLQPEVIEHIFASYQVRGEPGVDRHNE